MKKPEWLFVIVLTLIGAYFTYKYFTKTEKFNALQLAPRSTVAVYETKDVLSAFNKLQATAYWDDLQNIQEVQLATTLVNTVDSLAEKNKLIGRALKNNNTLLSLHVTGNFTAGLMVYLPVGADSRIIFDAALLKLTGASASHKTRIYDKQTIHELAAGDIRLTYVFYKDYAIVSTVGYLVEDVVRNLNNSFTNNFITDNPDLVKVPKLRDDAGNLYLDGEQLTAFYETFLPAKHGVVEMLARSVFLDISFTRDNAFLSGFLFADNQAQFASLFVDQEAASPASIKYVPDNAAAVMTISVSNVSQWYQRWQAKFANPASGEADGVLRTEFVKNIQGDITLASFATNDKSRQDKLLFVRLADKAGMLNVLNKQAEEIAAQLGDSVYFEFYADYKIGLIDREEFVELIFGRPFAGFSSTYFMLFDDYLVLASSAERLKKWIRDLEDDYVWGRSVVISEFIEENLGETSFALIFSNPWHWSMALSGLNKQHRDWWHRNEKTLKQFSMTAFQLTNLDNKFYTSVSIRHQPLKVDPGQQELNNEVLAQMLYRVQKKPKLVRNHRDGSWEILVQDSLNILSLLDKEGERFWSDSLPGPIVTKIYQIDYFKNRKLQYLFATDSVVFLIDRNGNHVEGFPVVIRDVEIKDLFVFDYDHNKEYRFLLADKAGSLHMFNQEMEPREGWSPLAFNSALTDQIYHVRVRGKDRILIARQNGMIDLKNRRGEEQPGFPLDLQFNINNPIHFGVGSTFESSRFTTVSLEGMVVQFDLNGKLYAQNQLYQASGSSVFNLVIDPANNDYIFTRQDLNRLAVLDKDGQVIFEKDYQYNNRKEVQYYYLGVDKQLFVVRDTDTGRIYIYDKDGTLINSGETYSDYSVSVVYRKSKSKCYIYTAKDQSVLVESFSF